MSKQWKLKAHKAAKKELDDLRDNHPRAFDAMIHTLQLLALEQNPLCPQNSQLNVCRLRHDAEGWFRLKIIGHAQWRVIIRFLGKRFDKVVFEIKFEDDIPREGGSIQVMKVGHRDTVYKEAQGRQDRVYYG